MPNDNNLFRAAIERQTTPTYVRSKADIIEHYRDTYGEKDWKSHLASDLAGTTDKKSKEYKSAIRHFQGDRLEKAAGRSAAPRFEAVGKQLPPVSVTPKDGTLTFTVGGSQSDPYGGHRNRTINHSMTGTTAYDFANNPNWQDFWEDYDVDADMMEDGEYEFSVGYVN
jgi:hypothetical protein